MLYDVNHTISFIGHHCITTGHINHSLFWKNLAPVAQGGGQLFTGPFKDALEAEFGTIDGTHLPHAPFDAYTYLYLLCSLAFKQVVNGATAAIRGSGWGWLGYNPDTRKLEAVTTMNQDPLLSTRFNNPIFVRN